MYLYSPPSLLSPSFPRPVLSLSSARSSLSRLAVEPDDYVAADRSRHPPETAVDYYV